MKVLHLPAKKFQKYNPETFVKNLDVFVAVLTAAKIALNPENNIPPHIPARVPSQNP